MLPLRRLPASAPSPAISRRGFSLLEVVVTTILLTAVTASALPVLVWAAAERRAAQQRHIALLEVGNVMERVAARPFDALTQPALDELVQEVEAAPRLHGQDWSVSLTEVTDPLPAKRVTLELRWQLREDRTAPPVRLTSWHFQPSGAAP